MAFSQTICYLLCLTGATSATTLAVLQKPYPVITETKEGVKTVTNPDYPRDGRYVAKLTVEMSCGEEGGAPAGVLNKPLRLDVDAQDNVYVMDLGDVNIKVYDSQGRYLRTIGRKGQGPAEFGEGACSSLMSDNRLCVLDVSQYRIIFMTTEGRYLSGFILDLFFNEIAVDNQDRIFLARRGAVKEPDRLSKELREIPYVTGIYRTDIFGKEVVHLTDILGESLLMSSPRSGQVISISGRRGSARDYRTVWSLGREGKFCGGFNGDYSLGVFGLDGQKELTFGRQYVPIRNPEFGGMVGQKKTLPVYLNVVLDEDGNMWVELFQAEGAKGFRYDVFSPDGIYLKQIEIEQRISLFKNGKIYSIVRSEEGYPSVKRYRMELAPVGQ